MRTHLLTRSSLLSCSHSQMTPSTQTNRTYPVFVQGPSCFCAISSFICFCCLSHFVLVYRIDPRVTFSKHPKKKAGYLLSSPSLVVFSSGFSSIPPSLSYRSILSFLVFHPIMICGDEFDLYTHVYPSPKR